MEYLPGISVQRGELLRKEIDVATYSDLLHYFPFRHVDKTRFTPISHLSQEDEYAYIKGTIVSKEIIGAGRARRLVAKLHDATGRLEMVWFQGLQWVDKILHVGEQYAVFGRTGFFLGNPQMAHPDLELVKDQQITGRDHLEPIYNSTEKMKSRGLGGTSIGKFVLEVFKRIKPSDIAENLPAALLHKYKLTNRFTAFQHIHFPPSVKDYEQALRRLKFEELFFSQLRLNLIRTERQRNSRGFVFKEVGTLFNNFFNNYLPFDLTGAQKKVLREIRQDMASGHQMNRLLQGDVGSGKTIVALMSMLLAADNGYQSVLMAPTEILANQHFNGLKALLSELPVEIALLTGSTKAKQRKEILAKAASGELHILIGTHAVIEDKVVFKNLGFVIIDEQHKFGVAQRARLQKKASMPPHVLVMTATPIPRTLALTAYGDLDYSVMDELPPGRKPVETYHRSSTQRNTVMSFIREQLDQGRQVYVIYPLIEESEKLDYEHLMQGYEEVKAYFPEPKYWISMVHGRQTAEEKETNMQRFVQYDTQIMVSTTVIEVGVNVPNATVMLIESSEKFGLSQLHQLRGRVGRGSEKSYCILMTGHKLSNDARERIGIMTATNDGFKIAEKDLELRGPGEIHGTRQSGDVLFKLADIVQDRVMLEVVRDEVVQLLDADPDLKAEPNSMVRAYLIASKSVIGWSKIA